MKRTLLALVALTWMATAVSDAAVHRLTDTRWAKEYPQINDAGQVGWRGFDGHEYELFLWEGPAVHQLTDDAYDNWIPLLNNRGQVAWMGRPDGRDFEIFLRDGSRVRQLTHNDVDDLHVQLADTGHVAWVRGQYPGPYALILWDGTSEHRLADDLTPDSTVTMNRSGQIAWNAPTPTGYEIYLWNGATRLQLTRDDLDDVRPEIGSGGHVVWEHILASTDSTAFSNGRREIRQWDGHATRQLTQGGGGNFFPRVNRSGGTVWMELGSASGPVLNLWDGTSIRRLAPESGAQLPAAGYFGHQINDAGQVVWDAVSSASVAAGPLLYHAYLWNGVSVQQLVRNTPSRPNPRLNNFGQVVWVAGSPNQDSEIYRYTPPRLEALVVAPTAIAGGETAIGRILLDEPAPAGGAIVALQSADPAVITLPPSVTIAEGVASATFRITASPIATARPVVLTASYGGHVQTATLTVARNRRPGLGTPGRP